VPYIVFPGEFFKLKGTGDFGDLGYAMNLAARKAHSSLPMPALVTPPWEKSRFDWLRTSGEQK
jgi:hypothetical protein